MTTLAYQLFVTSTAYVPGGWPVVLEVVVAAYDVGASAW
jgi:hypothetical protein